MTDDAPIISLDAALAVARAHVEAAVSLTKFVLKSGDDTARGEAARAAETATRSLLQLTAVIDPESRPASLTSLTADAEALEELQAQVDASQAALSDVRASNAELQTTLDGAREQVQQQRDAHERESRELNERLATLSSDNEQLRRELDEANEERHKLQLQLNTYNALIADGRAERAEPIDYEAPPAATIAGVIEIARDQCEHVAIPDAALREIDTLDADEKAADWARELWKGLRALNAYAAESEHFQGGFWEWCEHSNSEHNVWPASDKKLAMSESDTVMQTARLWKARRFKIDNQVEPQGYIHMIAHLKITEGGGQHIPRLYFHDDTGGRTGHVHVGFIGPHRLVPNTQS